MIDKMKILFRLIGVSLLSIVFIADFAVTVEKISIGNEVRTSPAPFTWGKLLSSPIAFQDLNDESDVYQDANEIQDFLANFGKSLDHCNSKVEESANISQHLIRQYMRRVLGRETQEERNDEDFNTDDVLNFVDFEEEVASISEEFLYTSYNDLGTGIWSSLHDVLISLNEACDDLPITIAEINFEDQEQHEQKAETILSQIIRAMTKWTQKWTVVLHRMSNNFIETCVTLPRCERNIEIVVEIFSKSLEKTKRMNLQGNEGINLHTIIGSSSFWDHVIDSNQIQDENHSAEESGDINSFFRARLENMVGIFGYFGTKSKTGNFEYIASSGIEGGIAELNPSTLNDVHLLEESDQNQDLENELAETDEDNLRMQRVVAAVVNVLRFPWKIEDTNKALLTIAGDAPLRKVPPTFLSLALESELIEDTRGKFDTGSTRMRNLMTHLTPAIFRLGGSSANFLSFDPSKANSVNQAEVGDTRENYYQNMNIGTRESPFAPFRSEYFNGNPYRHVSRNKFPPAYPVQSEVYNRVPRSHPKYRPSQNNVNHLKSAKVPDQKDTTKESMKMLSKHPKYRHHQVKHYTLEADRNIYETSRQSLPDDINNSVPANELVYPSVAEQNPRQPLGYPPHRSDSAAASQEAHSKHPKFRQHRDSLRHWNSDAPWNHGVSCQNERNEFHNYTVGESELDGLFSLCSAMNWTLMFDLNQFYRDAQGRWDPSNARLIIQSAKQHGANVIWQVGNEPNSYPHKFAFNISGSEMVDDVTRLRELLQETSYWQFFKQELGLTDDTSVRVVGPDVTRPRNAEHVAGLETSVGADSMKFLEEFLSVQPGIVDAISWHQYYVCGRTTTVEEFTSPAVMDFFVRQLRTVADVRDSASPDTPIWITETGSASGGGAPGLSNRFAGTFLWLDKLGVAARDGVDVVARQSLYGGNYAMLDTRYYPNPDYWVSVLHKQLVGGNVLKVELDGAPDTLRLYAHCAREQQEHGQPAAGGIVVYGLNSGDQAVEVAIQAMEGSAPVLQYLLTPALGDLTARDVLLNGSPLEVSEDGIFPPPQPRAITVDQLAVPAYSLGFWVLPEANLTACI